MEIWNERFRGWADLLSQQADVQIVLEKEMMGFLGCQYPAPILVVATQYVEADGGRE
jgi:hypothetical protein